MKLLQKTPRAGALRELLRPHVSKNACLVNGCKIQDLITDGNTAAKGF